MQLVIAPDSVPLEDASIAPDTGTPQWFRNANPNLSIPKTLCPAWWLNQIQSELANLCVAGNVIASATKTGQCWQALLGSHTFQDTGTPNAIVINPPSGLTVDALVEGMEITVIVANASTGSPVTMEFGGITKNVKRPDASNLHADDIGPGNYKFYFDGTQWKLFFDTMSNNLAYFASPLVGAGSGLVNEVDLGYGLALSGNVLYVT
jgi:hypothetical protein